MSEQIIKLSIIAIEGKPLYTSLCVNYKDAHFGYLQPEVRNYIINKIKDTLNLFENLNGMLDVIGTIKDQELDAGSYSSTGEVLQSYSAITSDDVDHANQFK